MSRLTIDDLRRELSQSGRTDDDCVLDFYADKEGREYAEAFNDETEKHRVATFAGWFRSGITALTISDVKDWLDEQYDVYAKDCDLTEDDVTREIEQELREYHMPGSTT